jgi:hypothetical protein
LDNIRRCEPGVAWKFVVAELLTVSKGSTSDEDENEENEDVEAVFDDVDEVVEVISARALALRADCASDAMADETGEVDKPEMAAADAEYCGPEEEEGVTIDKFDAFPEAPEVEDEEEADADDDDIDTEVDDEDEDEVEEVPPSKLVLEFADNVDTFDAVAEEDKEEDALDKAALEDTEGSSPAVRFDVTAIIYIHACRASGALVGNPLSN